MKCATWAFVCATWAFAPFRPVATDLTSKNVLTLGETSRHCIHVLARTMNPKKRCNTRRLNSMDPLAELEATLDRFDTISAWALATPNMQVLALASIAKDLRRIANSLEAKS